jgi:DNA-binding XRE family transcriptional regulator
LTTEKENLEQLIHSLCAMIYTQAPSLANRLAIWLVGIYEKGGEGLTTLLRKLRDERGFHQREIGERLGVSYASISRYEARKSRVDRKKQEKLAKIFDKRKDELFDAANFARSAPEE